MLIRDRAPPTAACGLESTQTVASLLCGEAPPGPGGCPVLE